MSWGDFVMGGYCPGGTLSRGDFVVGGFCHGGILAGGYCPGGLCPGGLCPRTIMVYNMINGTCVFNCYTFVTYSHIHNQMCELE